MGGLSRRIQLEWLILAVVRALLAAKRFLTHLSKSDHLHADLLCNTHLWE